MIQLDRLNTATQSDFVTLLDGIFEHAPWVAADTAGQRPFTTVDALHAALMRIVCKRSRSERILFQAGPHPPL